MENDDVLREVKNCKALQKYWKIRNKNAKKRIEKKIILKTKVQQGRNNKCLENKKIKKRHKSRQESFKVERETGKEKQLENNKRKIHIVARFRCSR